MNKIQHNCVVPSSVYSVPKKYLKYYIEKPEHTPQVGDLIYGEVTTLGFHKSLESISARIHTIHDRTRAIFVYGNRYAPDHYEGFVPESNMGRVDILARSGLVGCVKHTNDLIASPTQVKPLGYICDNEGEVVNSRNFVKINPKNINNKKPRAKIILSIGAAMNSGKSYTAAACCYALTSAGRTVRAAKITGTASLKDILLMQDCGAQHIADFTSFGYPSTYMLEMNELLNMFKAVDAKYGNNPRNYMVLEFADGLFQRETRMLLEHPEIKDRIHKLIFCASDAAGIAGGLSILEKNFKLSPDAISGLCSSSPLAIKEIQSFTDIPILKSMERDYMSIFNIIK